MNRVAVAVVVALLLAGCTSPATPSAPPSVLASGPTTSATPTAGAPPSSIEPSVTEPTTTNTLPAPPVPTSAPPSTAGPLTSTALPVPAGWRTVVLGDDAEEGFKANGSWVHKKDPRYAARDLIAIGCAEVTRDDYPDPKTALEGNYIRDHSPGVGLALQFGSAADATAYFERYLAQVRACTDPDVVRATVERSTSTGLIDRRHYPDESRWTEVAAVRGERATFIILDDDGGTTVAAAEKLLDRIS